MRKVAENSVESWRNLKEIQSAPAGWETVSGSFPIMKELGIYIPVTPRVKVSSPKAVRMNITFVILLSVKNKWSIIVVEIYGPWILLSLKTGNDSFRFNSIPAEAASNVVSYMVTPI